MAYSDSTFLLWWTHGGKRREFRDPRTNLCSCSYSGPEQRATAAAAAAPVPAGTVEQDTYDDCRITTAA